MAIPASELHVASDLSSVRFLEIEDNIDPASLAQHTRVYRTTLALQQTAVGDLIHFRIAAARRTGPLVQIRTPGQVQAGALTRLDVHGAADLFPVASAEIRSASGTIQPLRVLENGVHGLFVAAQQSATLAVHLRSTAGEALVVPHAYQVRESGDGAVERMGDTRATRFLTVTVAADGTVCDVVVGLCP